MLPMQIHPEESSSSVRRALPATSRNKVVLPGSFAYAQGAHLQFTDFDAAYLERLQSRDAGTERHFVDYFSELIRLKLRSRLNSKEAIEDVKQETFARVFAILRSKDGVKHPDRLGALVNSVCNFVLLEHYRAKVGKETTIEDEPETSFIDQDPTPSGLFQTSEAQAIVRKILVELPERDRRLLQSVLLEERDKDEVCEEMGLSREYLRVMVHRAKQTFKSFFLKETGVGGPRP